MARQEVEPKTPLGARLRQVRNHFGVTDRGDFAQQLGVGKSTLALYERGERTPDADVLALYRSKLGIDVNWLATGIGEMFADSSKAPAPTGGYDVVLLAKLGDAVQAVFLQAKQSAPPRAITTEAGRLYNELLGMVKDIRDEKVVEAMIPVLRERFRERIQNAEPGSGKRSAS